MELPKKPVVAVSSQQMEGCRAEIQENHDDTYGVPSLEELGEYVLQRATCHGPPLPVQDVAFQCPCQKLENTGLVAHACNF